MGDDTMKWARDLVDQKAWVLHTTRVVGRVTEFYDGQGRRYVSDYNGSEVTAPVLVVEPPGGVPGAVNHTFVATADNFVRLEEKEAKFYVAAQQAIAHAASECVKFAASSGIRPRSVLMLLAAALRTQVNEFERIGPDGSHDDTAHEPG
jgi:hypothetical protein